MWVIIDVHRPNKICQIRLLETIAYLGSNKRDSTNNWPQQPKWLCQTPSSPSSHHHQAIKTIGKVDSGIELSIVVSMHTASQQKAPIDIVCSLPGNQCRDEMIPFHMQHSILAWSTPAKDLNWQADTRHYLLIPNRQTMSCHSIIWFKSRIAV